MTALIDRLSAATGPDRALDAEIETTVHPGTTRCEIHNGQWCRVIAGGRHPLPHYTASVDVALALSPDCKEWAIRRRPNTLPHFSASFLGKVGYEVAFGATAAIAACVAILKARQP